MAYNLTSKQKEAARSLIHLGRTWREEFCIIWHDPDEISDILDYAHSPPQISRGDIRALERAGLLICNFLSNSKVRVTLSLKGYEAVDSDFETPDVSLNTVSILFLAADPTDQTRLRLGEEFREIQEKLQLSKERERFKLHQRMSVRPADISQALLDIQPQIVHFSGHGTTSGALCLENQIGVTHPIQPQALAALFKQFTNQVECVLLNACYSEDQANAIAQHIDYVIGMSQEIDDKAAIAFAVGFYQALGAGRSVYEAYELGSVQIGLQGISEHLTPVLVKKGQWLSPISSNSLPSNAILKVKIENLKALLNIAEEILEQANSSLLENEKVLIPLFQDASVRDRVYADMLQLYHSQRNRGDFGRWKSFLETAIEKETDQEICGIITDLLLDVNRLYDAFYRTSPYSSMESSKNMTIDKLSVANSLNRRKRQVLSYQKILEIVRWYLDYLREIVEHIGYSIGKLRSML